MSKQLQSIADDLAKALESVDTATLKRNGAKEALEKTAPYKSYEKAQQEVEKAESEASALKESLFAQMQEDEEKNVEAGEYRIHTSEKTVVNVGDEETLFSWLKKKKVYDTYVKTDPTIDKRALNKFIMGLSNDRQLPKADVCGVEVAQNKFIVVTKKSDE